MKKQILFFLISLLGLLGTAQRTKVFVLDLDKPTKNSLRVKGKPNRSNPLEIKTKQLIAIELINANPFKYKYVISNKVVDFFKDDKVDPFTTESKPAQPALNNQEVSKRLENKEIENLNKKLNNILLNPSSPNAKSELLESFSTYRRNIEKSFQKEKTMITSLNDLTSSILNKEVKDQTINVPSINQIEMNISDLSQETNNTFANLQSQQSIRGKLRNTSKIRKSITDITANYLEINKMFLSLENEAKKYALEALLELSLKMEFLYSDMEDYKKQIEVNDALNKKEFIEQRGEFDNSLKGIVRKINELSLKVSKSEIEGLLDEYNKDFQRFSKAEERVKKILSTFHSVRLDYFTVPVDFNGDNIDAVQIDVTRTRISDGVKLDDITYIIWIRGGVKFDVSAGVFLSSLVDKSYGKQDVTVSENGMDVTRQMIFEREANSYKIGFGSTLNISPRKGGSWFKPMLSVGAMLREDQNFQLIAGGGFTLGKKERILFQFGTVMGTVTRLANNYNLNDTFEISGGDDAIPTVQRFQFGHFFGISYNLGKTFAQGNK